MSLAIDIGLVPLAISHEDKNRNMSTRVRCLMHVMHARSKMHVFDVYIKRLDIKMTFLTKYHKIKEKNY